MTLNRKISHEPDSLILPPSFLISSVLSLSLACSVPPHSNLACLWTDTMHSLTCTPVSSPSHTLLKPNNNNPLLGSTWRPCPPLKRRACFTTRALLSSTKETVLKDFQERRALKVKQNPNFPTLCSICSFCWLSSLIWIVMFLKVNPVENNGKSHLTFTNDYYMICWLILENILNFYFHGWLPVFFFSEQNGEINWQQSTNCTEIYKWVVTQENFMSCKSWKQRRYAKY